VLAGISPRIRDAIRDVEDRNEILLSWCQVGLVSLLALLYFAAPKGFQMAIPFEPVPLILAAYAPWVLFRLALAHLRRLGPWLLTVSILLDVGAIVGLIWSYHLQYSQPPAFSLKATTYGYLFVFIALRSLRYEIGYVLLTGGAGIVGWLLLVGYSLAAKDATITHDFAEYVVGTPILIGAEIDKMIALAAVTVVLAVGVSRSRRLLAMAALESQARRALARFFSPEVASRILGAATPIRPGQGELRSAAVLTMDLRGFTRFAQEVSPDEVMSLLAEWQKRMCAQIFACGGTIDKFMGDGILAHFGAATPSDTYAADAVRAVERLEREVDAWNSARGDGRRFGVGIACAAGPTIFGAVGDEERLEYTVIGDAVNLAAKLEKHTKTACVRALATRDVYELARSQGYVAASEPKPLSGENVEGVHRTLDLVAFGTNGGRPCEAARASGF
jgi:adenylate cyclase